MDEEKATRDYVVSKLEDILSMNYEDEKEKAIEKLIKELL